MKYHTWFYLFILFLLYWKIYFSTNLSRFLSNFVFCVPHFLKWFVSKKQNVAIKICNFGFCLLSYLVLAVRYPKFCSTIVESERGGIFLKDRIFLERELSFVETCNSESVDLSVVSVLSLEVCSFYWNDVCLKIVLSVAIIHMLVSLRWLIALDWYCLLLVWCRRR